MSNAIVPGYLSHPASYGGHHHFTRSVLSPPPPMHPDHAYRHQPPYGCPPPGMYPAWGHTDWASSQFQPHSANQEKIVIQNPLKAEKPAETCVEMKPNTTSSSELKDIPLPPNTCSGNHLQKQFHLLKSQTQPEKSGMKTKEHTSEVHHKKQLKILSSFIKAANATLHSAGIPNNHKLVDYGASDNEDSGESDESKNDKDLESEVHTAPKLSRSEPTKITFATQKSVPRPLLGHAPQALPTDRDRMSPMHQPSGGSPFIDPPAAVVYIPPHKRRIVEKDIRKQLHKKDGFASEGSSTDIHSPVCSPPDPKNQSESTRPFWSCSSSSSPQSMSPLCGTRMPSTDYNAYYQTSSYTNSPFYSKYSREKENIGDCRSDIPDMWRDRSSKGSDIGVFLPSAATGEMMMPPRLRFLQKSKLMASDSPSLFKYGKDYNWKETFKTNCRQYAGKFIDSHCHLDFLFNRTPHRGTWSQFKEANAATMPDNYEGCLAIFCNPNSFKSEGRYNYKLVQNSSILCKL